MNTPSPLLPQGATFPQDKSHVRIAVFTILALHLILLGALLLQGCKRTTETAYGEPTNQGFTPEPVQPTNLAPVEPFVVAQPPRVTAPPEPAPAPTFTSTEPVPTPLTPAVPTPRSTTPRGVPMTRMPTTVTPDVVIPAPRPASAPASGVRSHVVIKGESFYSIGKKYGVSAQAIAKANPGVEPRALRIGQSLTIPAPPPAAPPAPQPGTTVSTTAGTVYVVKSGDYLGRIAEQFGTTVSELKSENQLSSDKIKVGQTLRIPR